MRIDHYTQSDRNAEFLGALLGVGFAGYFVYSLWPILLPLGAVVVLGSIVLSGK